MSSTTTICARGQVGVCCGQFRPCCIARGSAIEVEPEQRDAEPGDEYGENQKLDGLVVVQAEGNADDTH
ncbi:hypothetical protein ABT116_46530, partial [Streptomyces sp. NPDC002130]|uniref:hypothetical protein n=1 Tax=Streptomyces sp. NPDC002130 TaxID=3155568 RepID=UPI00332F65D6